MKETNEKKTTFKILLKTIWYGYSIITILWLSDYFTQQKILYVFPMVLPIIILLMISYRKGHLR